MNFDIGSVVGTSIIVIFGGIVAFGVPALMRRHMSAEALAAETLPIHTWFRILGIIVMVVGLVQIAIEVLVPPPSQ